MTSLIGVDIGGTQIRAARFDLELNMQDRAEQLTRSEEGSDAVLDRICETIRQVFPEDPDDIAGIGVAIPGPLDAKTGVIINPPNVPFRNVPLKQHLTDTFHMPVYVGNDADLAGLGEYTLGAGIDATTMIYMTISTGVGGGIVIDHKPLIGGGLAGEIGHMVVDPNGPMCTCGHQGHLEAISSGKSIARAAREKLMAGAESMLREMVNGDLESITARHVSEAAHAGDQLALDVVTNAGRHIGIMIASLMTLLNPDMFVLGGGVTLIGDLLFDPIRAAAQEYCIHKRYWENTPIVRAELGDDVGLVGAAALVRSNLDG